MGRKQKYRINLSKTERNYLESYLQSGTHSTRLLNRVRCLLFADRGEFGFGWKDAKVAEAVGVSKATVANTRKKHYEDGLERAIHRKDYDNSNRERKLNGKGEAELIALVMSDPPEGYSNWTLRLLSDYMVRLDIVDSISHEGVRYYLKKMNLNLGTVNLG